MGENKSLLGVGQVEEGSWRLALWLEGGRLLCDSVAAR